MNISIKFFIVIVYFSMLFFERDVGCWLYSSVKYLSYVSHWGNKRGNTVEAIPVDYYSIIFLLSSLYIQ